MIFCINCKRKVLVNHDLNSLCSCIITYFPILGDRNERLKIRESRTYLVFAIRRSTSHPKLIYNSSTNSMRLLHHNVN